MVAIGNLYLIVYNHIKLGYNPSRISNKLGLSKSRIQYYINKLQSEGLIKKIGYGTWEATKKRSTKEVQIKLGSPHQPTNQPDDVRGHAWVFTLKIPKLANWDQRRKYLDKRKISWHPIGSNWQGERLLIQGFKVWLTHKSIVVFFPKSYSIIRKKAIETKKYATYEFLKRIKKVESLLKCSFQLNKKYKFKVSRQHYGLIKNALARQYDKEDRKFNVYDEGGLWFSIDNSYNLHEAETLHPKTALSDNEKIQRFFNQTKETGLMPKQVLKMMKQVAYNQAMFDSNFSTHLGVIHDLGAGVQDLRKEIKNLMNLIEDIMKNKRFK